MEKLFYIILFLSVPLLALGSPFPLVETFNRWILYVEIREGHALCFITSTPFTSVGNQISENSSRIWVRHVKQNIDEVTITSGYNYDPNISPQLAIYSRKTEFLREKQLMINTAGLGNCNKGKPDEVYIFDFVEGEQAWFKNADDDRRILESLKASLYAVVVAKTRNNSCSTDFYSLRGFERAHKKMKEICE